MSFKDFNLSESIYLGLQDLRYEQPTPIQQKSIPLILEGKDVIGAAQTGTGKTGAFVIPLLEKILNNKSEHTQALILSPTRELASQIDEQIFALGYHTGITSATVIGGSDFGEQVKAIRAGVDVIVATPGRLLDQMNVLNLDFSHVNYLVLDEADRMLDMGFLPDVSKIVESLPADRQTLLFSATMPEGIRKIIKKIMKEPVRVEIEVSKPVDSVDQQVYFVDGNKRLQLLESIFDDLDWSTAIIFTATKRGTDQLERLLKKRNVKAVSMHGDRSQEERNEALRQFKNKAFPVMVATDVLARGIDIDNVSLIINYDVPNSPDDYIHRIGRTGRYDKKGTAITFVTRTGRKFYDAIKKVVGDQITVKELPADNPPKEKTASASDKSKGKTSAKKTSGKETTTKKSPAKVSREELPERPSSSKKESTDKQDEEVPTEQEKVAASEKIAEESDSKEAADEQEIKTPKQDKRRKPQSASSPNRHNDEEDDYFKPEIIEKAVARNRRARKPAKGIWGIIKSCIPKIRAS